MIIIILGILRDFVSILFNLIKLKFVCEKSLNVSVSLVECQLIIILPRNLKLKYIFVCIFQYILNKFNLKIIC